MRKIDLQQLKEMVDQGYVNVQRHPTEDLFIYNYSIKAQVERYWNDATLQCRGLILNGKGEVISRPFVKFFNIEEVENLPNEPFCVYEKVDGSLGILYWIGNEPFIATRGSFTSDQAEHANYLLRTVYRDSIAKLTKGKTYLFEIVYPENRIVVNYGDRDELVLLAILDTATGADCFLEDIGFPIVKTYDGVDDYRQIQSLNWENSEGFVVRFESGLRVKIKFAEYKRLHKIVTETSSITIWHCLSEGGDFGHLLEDVPDEFMQWAIQVKNNLTDQYRQIENEARLAFRVVGDRKKTAAYFLTCKYPHIMFCMLDHRDYSPLIWRMLRPKHEKPF